MVRFVFLTLFDFRKLCAFPACEDLAFYSRRILLEHVPRETLFHFAARLGLSTFVTLLLEKNGAESCLQLKNQHGELAKDIAEERGFDGLADLITE